MEEMMPYDAPLSSERGDKAEQGRGTAVGSGTSLRQTQVSFPELSLPRHMLFGKKISSL